MFHTIENDTGSSGTSYTDTGVAAETRYVYRIKAINNHGLSERSSWFDADTPEAPAETQDAQQQSAPPAAPTGPLTAATHDQVLLSWDDPDDDSITGYRILRCPDADSLSVIVENTNSASTSYTDQDVEAETAYVYTVRAINESGAAEASESVGVTTQKAPEETIPSLRQDGGICDRTDAVADAIVAAVDGVSDCEDITSAHLEEITSLNLEGQSVASLQSGDFAGLTGLTALALASNSLTELPAGVFDKLTALQELSLASNSLDTLPDEVFDKLTVMTNLNLRTNSLDALRMGVFDKNTALTTLDLSVNPLTSLPSDVFDNLTALTTLDLQGNSLTGLPSGVFDENTALTTLYINANSLTGLPSGVFEKITALTNLDLNNNDLEELAANVFNSLTVLDELGLAQKGRESLPAEVFDNLAALTDLILGNNELTVLTDDVFENLTALVSLDLNDNPGSAGFKPTANAGEDLVVDNDAMVMLDGSGSDSGPWGSNVTYAWEKTNGTGGALAGTDTTMPTLTAQGARDDLVFTLTVTGRGRGPTGNTPTRTKSPSPCGPSATGPTRLRRPSSPR